MPQIAQLSGTYASQIFWVLLFFGFIFFVIGRGMVPKVMATVDARDSQIASDLAAAEAARKAADAEEESWRVQSNAQRAEAHEVMAKAKAEAAKQTEARLAKATKTIDARLVKAETAIATARASAMDEIETVAGDAAKDIVARLAGTKVTAAAVRTAVKGALNG